MLEGTGHLLLSDEVYRASCSTGSPCLGPRYEALRSRAFVVFSFGKVFPRHRLEDGLRAGPGSPGWRSSQKVHQFNVFEVNTPMQHAQTRHLQEPAHYEAVSPDVRGQARPLPGRTGRTRFRPIACEGSYFKCGRLMGPSGMFRPRVLGEWLAGSMG